MKEKKNAKNIKIIQTSINKQSIKDNKILLIINNN